MYHVLIADDEPKVCSLIRYAVDWERLGLEITGVAQNGIEALEMIARHRIDIVITDIRMPGCDGLELIQKAKAINDQISFVIISGHRQFDYAQKAIRYGVDDYLLKPLDENELTRILQKMIKAKDSERAVREQKQSLEKQVEKDSERLRKTFIETLIREPERLSVPLDSDVVNEEYHCQFADGCYQVVVIKADIRRQERQAETYRLLERQVQYIAESEMRPGSKELLSLIAPEGIFVLLNFDQDYDRELRKRLKQIRARICSLRDLFWEISATAGIGCMVDSLTGIQQSIDTARRAVFNRIFLGVNHTIGALEAEDTELVMAELINPQIRFSLNEQIETLNEEAIGTMIAEIRQRVDDEEKMDGERLLLLCMELLDTLALGLKKMCAEPAEVHLLDRFLSGFYMSASVDEVFAELTTIFFGEIRRVVQQKEQSETRPIREARKYLQEHYNEQVTLVDVSRMVGFNANYFSGMFKEQVGMNFSDYLIHLRIEKAKQLLVKGGVTMTDIAIEIGYSDAKYFSKMFKKSTGLTPMEFCRLYQKMS